MCKYLNLRVLGFGCNRSGTALHMPVQHSEAKPVKSIVVMCSISHLQHVRKSSGLCRCETATASPACLSMTTGASGKPDASWAKCGQLCDEWFLCTWTILGISLEGSLHMPAASIQKMQGIYYVILAAHSYSDATLMTVMRPPFIHMMCSWETDVQSKFHVQFVSIAEIFI